MFFTRAAAGVGAEVVVGFVSVFVEVVVVLSPVSCDESVEVVSAGSCMPTLIGRWYAAARDCNPLTNALSLAGLTSAMLSAELVAM